MDKPSAAAHQENPRLGVEDKKVKGYLVCGIAEGGWGNRIRNAGYSSSVSLARGFSKCPRGATSIPQDGPWSHGWG